MSGAASSAGCRTTRFKVLGLDIDLLGLRMGKDWHQTRADMSRPYRALPMPPDNFITP